LKRSENEARVIKEYDDIYELLLFPAFLLLVAEACMSDRRPRRSLPAARRPQAKESGGASGAASGGDARSPRRRAAGEGGA